MKNVLIHTKKLKQLRFLSLLFFVLCHHQTSYASCGAVPAYESFNTDFETVAKEEKQSVSPDYRLTPMHGPNDNLTISTNVAFFFGKVKNASTVLGYSSVLPYSERTTNGPPRGETIHVDSKYSTGGEVSLGISPHPNETSILFCYNFMMPNKFSNSTTQDVDSGNIVPSFPYDVSSGNTRLSYGVAGSFKVTYIHNFALYMCNNIIYKKDLSALIKTGFVLLNSKTDISSSQTHNNNGIPEQLTYKLSERSISFGAKWIVTITKSLATKLAVRSHLGVGCFVTRHELTSRDNLLTNGQNKTTGLNTKGTLHKAHLSLLNLSEIWFERKMRNESILSICVGYGIEITPNGSYIAFVPGNNTLTPGNWTVDYFKVGINYRL